MVQNRKGPPTKSIQYIIRSELRFRMRFTVVVILFGFGISLMSSQPLTKRGTGVGTIAAIAVKGIEHFDFTDS